MAETATEMAQRIIAAKERVSVETVLDLTEVFLISLSFPPAIPFALVAAAIAIPLEKLNNKLKTANDPMPKEWYPAVWGTASDDGRFFIGRLLSNGGSVSVSEAMRFLVIEAEATKRKTHDPIALTPGDAKEQLTLYYGANQTLFDKAVVAVGKIVTVAITHSVDTTTNVIKEALKKIRRGF